MSLSGRENLNQNNRLKKNKFIDDVPKRRQMIRRQFSQSKIRATAKYQTESD